MLQIVISIALKAEINAGDLLNNCTFLKSTAPRSIHLLDLYTSSQL